MNVHIYKGLLHKSVIFEQMISSQEHVLGIVYYEQNYTRNRPNLINVADVYMIPSNLVSEDEFVDNGIPYFLEETEAQMVIIYTNRTEEENSYLIEKLQAFKDIRTVILMCY